MEREWITPNDAAALLGLTGQAVRAGIREGRFESLPAKQVPHEERKNHTQRYLLRSQVEALAAEGYGTRLFAHDGKSPSYEDCVYMACFIDSEGCVFINRQRARNNRPVYSVGLTLTNTYRPVVEWAYETFGGSFQERRRGAAHWRFCYVCYQWCTTAYRTLQRVAPYMKIKHEQARLAIDFYERTVAYQELSGRRLTDAERAWRAEQYEELKRMNSEAPSFPPLSPSIRQINSMR